MNNLIISDDFNLLKSLRIFDKDKDAIINVENVTLQKAHASAGASLSLTNIEAQETAKTAINSRITLDGKYYPVNPKNTTS